MNKENRLFVNPMMIAELTKNENGIEQMFNYTTKPGDKQKYKTCTTCGDIFKTTIFTRKSKTCKNCKKTNLTT